MPHLIIFEHNNFRGTHKHIFQTETNFHASNDKFFGDKISSFAIIDGRWQFHQHTGMQGVASNILGPGLYASTTPAGILNDYVSSISLIP